jgi:hypothetical protein
MNAFDDTRLVEQRSLKILRPFIQQRVFNGQFVVTSRGPLARDLQVTVGDIVYNSDAETCWGLEIKAEDSNKHGNFFFETWSNRERFTPGWMFSLNTDLLAYHFLEDDELYVIPFQKLRRWAFGFGAEDGHIYVFPERKQTKRTQLNDTWGRCVPIEILTAELGLRPPFKPLTELGGYDAADDLARSIEDCYGAVRERKASGGSGWDPPE